MFQRALSRFTVAALAGAAVTCTVGVASAAASPPTHERSVVRDIAETIPPLDECPGIGPSIDIVFTDIFHSQFTDNTFHVGGTQIGTFVVRSATGDALASGHFTTTFSNQGPGFPTLTFTDQTIATGRAVDGTQVRIHLTQHITVTANGEVTVDRITVSCG